MPAIVLTRRRLAQRFARFGAAGLAALALLPLQDPRKQAALERAEKRTERAVAEREEAYNALLAEYDATEAWFEGQDPGAELPAVVAAWLEDVSIPLDQADTQRKQARAAGPFHELWNRTLYRHSRPAKAYASAMEELEGAFLAVEKLRHPARFQRGFEKTPDGMALIPSGKYTLGPATGDILEQPRVHEEDTVKLRQFYLDKREVSCADYARFLLAQPPALREQHLPDGWGTSPEGAPLFPEGQGPYPVTGVSWVSAARYAEWDGKRLPTEEEWEAAAAGEERRRYPAGDRFYSSKVNCRAHGAGAPRNPMEFSEDHTPLGILCMTGNVREWTATGFNGRDVRDPGPNDFAAVRGGSYLDDADACQSNYRWLFPALERFPHVGFRCAKDVR